MKNFSTNKEAKHKVTKELSILLKENGVCKGNSLLSRDEINDIKNQIYPYFKSVSKLPNYSDRILRKNEAVFEVTDLCAVSQSAANYVLKNEIIDNVQDYFGEKIRIGQFRFLKQIRPNNFNLLSHCDGTRSVLLMLSLSGQDDFNGPTFFFKKSHKLRKESKKIFIGKNQYLKHKSNIDFYVANDLKPGDFVLFDVRTWHGRIPPSYSGREVIWVSFFPLSNEEKTLDSLFKISSLTALTIKQKDVLGLTSKFNNRQKNLEDQYLDNIKNPTNIGSLGRLIDFLFLRISKFYSNFKYLVSNFKKYLFSHKDKKIKLDTLFYSKPSGKDIDPKQMI